MRFRYRFLLLSWVALLSYSPQGVSSPINETRPVEGLRDNTPSVYALINARIVIAPGHEIERGTLVVRDGRIAAVGADVELPADAPVFDKEGCTIYPGFIDAYSEKSFSLPEGGTPYWNQQVRPQLSVAERIVVSESEDKKFRSMGFVSRLLAPSRGIIRGRSSLIRTSGDDGENTFDAADVAMHIRLTVQHQHDDHDYPHSPMGAVALARQAFLDAQWYSASLDACQSDPRLTPPQTNDALAALATWLDNDGMIFASTNDEQYLLRADLFAREFDLNLVVLGSGHEYRRLEAVAATGRTIVVPLDFPKAPNVATPEAARNITLERLLHWDNAPENPARLADAGVRIALTSHGIKGGSGAFLKKLREAVERGLARDDALAALTTTPAQLYGVADRLGTIEPGKQASFFVTDGDIFEEDSKILATWIDGIRFEVHSSPLYDMRGHWEIELDDQTLQVTLSGKAESPGGSIQQQGGDAEEMKLKGVGLRDARFSCTFDSASLDREGVAQISAVISSSDDDTLSWSGYIYWPDGIRSPFVGSQVDNEEEAPEEDEHEEENNTSDEPADDEPVKATFPMVYPLGSYGRPIPPEQPSLLLFQGGTVWTCGEEGIIERGSVLVLNGQIIEVGRHIDAPEGTVIIDCTGKHITPGIIDCHSHMGTDGGINEATQAITAEVRIGDFIDSNDIAIYRQLAGGVTASNILHGSANPIGGQNQVIKLRWGLLPEEIKFVEAPEGIKFALGENVKQSNWGEGFSSRYPQTRMGVEQLYRDTFRSAQQYDAQWQAWDRTHQGIPPRRDLELEALAEIVRGERWIHCHSYRQDEILALLRVLEDNDIQIGTFQHILEGYKVAEEMAEHGAMASSFADWWAYKFEVYDAIPFNGALLHDAGIVVSFNSDDREMARHLNQEAAKAVRYGGVSEEEALKFVTLNPALQLRIDEWVGSIEIGKNADIVVWSGPPLSNLSRCEQTWVDGRRYFDIEEDQSLRTTAREQRVTLIQKILRSGVAMAEPGEEKKWLRELWPNEDTYCGHDHGNGHGSSHDHGQGEE